MWFNRKSVGVLYDFGVCPNSRDKGGIKGAVNLWPRVHLGYGRRLCVIYSFGSSASYTIPCRGGAGVHVAECGGCPLHTIPWVCYRRRNQWLPYHTILKREPTNFKNIASTASDCVRRCGVVGMVQVRAVQPTKFTSHVLQKQNAPGTGLNSLSLYHTPPCRVALGAFSIAIAFIHSRRKQRVPQAQCVNAR